MDPIDTAVDADVMTAPPPLTVCMVAYNEEENIAASLASVKGWAGEVVVIDCESQDATGEIARMMGARVSRHPNILPEATKNVAFDLATTEWVFLLDADERLPDELKREISGLIARDPLENGFKIPRRNFYFGTPLTRGGAYPDLQLRLFRRGHGRFPARGIHERIAIDGKVGVLRHPFDHHPYPTFQAWIEKFEFYTRYEADRLRAEGASLRASAVRRAMIYRPLRRWIERLFIKRGIRDGVPGILAATFDLMTIVVGFGRFWMGEIQEGRMKR